MKVFVVMIAVDKRDTTNYPFFTYSPLPFDDPQYSTNTSSSKAIGVYGFTKDKTILDEFVKYRDNQIFHVKKMNLTYDEYIKFSKRYYDYELYMIKYSGVPIVSSNFEHSLVGDMVVEDIYARLADIGDINIDIFGKSIRDSLQLLYADIILNAVFDDSDFDMCEYNRWTYDQITLFIDAFGNTFKLGKE